MTIVNQETIQQLKAVLGSSKEAISVDTETNYTDKYSDRFCVGIAVCIDGRDTYYIPVGHLPYVEMYPADNVEIRPDLFDGVEVPIIFHNAKFDIHVLQRVGLKFPLDHHNIQDTMIMAYLIEENWALGLDELSKRHLGNEGKRHELKDVLKKLGGNDSWPTFPPMYMAPYAETDAQLTYDLYWHLLPMLEMFREPYEDRIKYVKALQEVESNGLAVDVALCHSLEQQSLVRMQAIRTELGFDPAKTTQLHPKLFAMPPIGLGLLPSSLTPKLGKPQVNDEFLQAHAGFTICALTLEYRGLQKAMSTYFRAYQNLADDQGILHPNFKPTGTVTGRLSCDKPNLQQIPREGYHEVKKVFRPRLGFQLWEIDYATIEWRLAAVYAEEESILEQFRDRDGDFHGMVAKRLGVDRQKAKTVNFALIYLAGALRLAGELDCELKIATKIRNDYLREFKKVFDTAKAVNYKAEQNGHIRMWSGRYRHFHIGQFGLRPNFNDAWNSLIQGGASDILLRSTLMVREAGFEIVNLVHDSLWLNLRSEDEAKQVQAIMEDWTTEFFGLPFYTEAKRLR